ncbi:MAG: hypothetical protein IT211_05620 [Armatimonadetes bacterium]|nr:hypothetical protein [Armatimonadota bacterium]
MAEGFLGRLNNNERSVAARLAILGEVFSKEAAEMIIEDSLEWIHRLQQLGILSRSNINPSPIVGIQSTPPLAFTHTLVHQQLLIFSAVESDVLCSILQQSVPLYTTTVLRYLATASSVNLNQSTIEPLFGYALHQAEEIAYGSRWLIAADWYNVAEFCLERLGQLGGDIVESTIKLLLTKIYISRPDADVMPTLDTVMRLTSNISSIEIARYRLALFEHCFHWGWKTEDPETHEVLWNEITAIIEMHPSLRYSHDYVGVLFGYKQYVQYAVPNYAFRYELHRRIDVISDISNLLLFDEKSNEYFTAYERITLAKLTFMPIKDVDLTSLFFDWIEKIAPEIEPNSYTQKEYDQLIVLYMEKSGYVTQSLAAANRCIQFCEEHGRLRSVAIMRTQLMFAQLLIGRSPKEIVEEYHVLVEQSKSWAFHVSTRDWGDQLICGFMLRGAIKEATLIIQRHSYSLVHLIIAYLSGDFEWIFSSIENKKINSRMANFIYYSYKGELSNNTSCVQQVSDVFNKKVIRYLDILMKICIVDTVQYIRTNHNQHYDMVTSKLGDIHAVLNQCLIYFEERQLGACIPPLLDRHKEWFSAKELKHWQSVAENLISITQKHLSIHADQKIRISMLGTISVTVADKPLHRPQGDRVRSALGLMVANEIFQSKLPIAEFDEIATGINNDPEHARANMRVIIDRIRKMIGRDAVVTEIGQAPRLHTKIVSVDLLVAAEKIAAATSALQKQRFVLAVDSLLAALQIVGTEVPYPTLYDSFFESARQEFEYSLRTAVLATAKTLIDVGDDNQAMQILKEAVQSLRGDEEVIELTCNVLERSGKFIEAERLKRDHRLLLV